MGEEGKLEEEGAGSSLCTGRAGAQLPDPNWVSSGELKSGLRASLFGEVTLNVHLNYYHLLPLSTKPSRAIPSHPMLRHN